jgi:hypothetical protein
VLISVLFREAEDEPGKRGGNTKPLFRKIKEKRLSANTLLAESHVPRDFRERVGTEQSR